MVDHAGARRSRRRRPRPRSPCCRVASWRSAAAPSCRAPAARRRSARWPPRSGTSAWRSAPAARAAARRAPCARSCWRRSSRAASLAVALGAGQHVGRVAALVLVDRRRRPPPRCAVQTASRNQRSWVTTSIAPSRAARWPASQAIASTSRWLVGSSSSSRSGWSSSTRASAIRRRSPPDSARDGGLEPLSETA